jgi:translation initiation factor 5B
MTKAQKAKAQKLEDARRRMEVQGLVASGSKDGEEKKAKVVYGKKKKPQNATPAPSSEPTPAPEPLKEEPLQEEPKVEEPPQVEEQPPKIEALPQEDPQSESEDESDDGSVDWENDDIDLDQIVEKNTAKKEKKAMKEVIVDKAAEEEKKREEELVKKGNALKQKEAELASAVQVQLEKEEAERLRIENARLERERREMEARKASSKDKLRCPICCVLGHVDVGKTKILDKIRSTNVQDGEAGGITQQIGATHFPREDIIRKTKVVKKEGMEYLIPGLLVVDTPGHESFTNLRSRGSSLCDIAILVVDIMHGLEPQTLESIQLLKSRKTPFIVALNKIDRCYSWEAIPDNGVRDSLSKQKDTVKMEFRDRVAQAKLAFAEQGLNSELYWENNDLGRTVSLVPTSAHTGEGIPDMLMLLVQLTQTRMSASLMFKTTVECTILEVKIEPGLGATIDCVLVNGTLNEGDTIVVCGMKGPIVTTIRALLTPPPMKEIRIKSEYIHNKSIEAAIGVKVSAQHLDDAIAGTALYVLGPDDDEEELKEEVMKDYETIMKGLKTSGRGCYVQASSLGSLEALLEFLKSQDPPIPVGGVNIGPIHKKDVIRASIMLEHQKEYATILAFDVKVNARSFVLGCF